MIKKIILGGVIFLCSSFYAFPQFNITITDSRIPDTHSCNEGDLKHYIVTITQSGTIYTFYQFAASVTNGTITQQSLIAHFPPLQPIELYVDIRWNCQVTAGSLTVYDPNSSSSATYNTTILFYINDPNYCRTATPNKQNLFYGQTPLQLDLVTCSAYCQATNDVTYQYQWQVGDVPIGVFPQEPPGGFTDIPNQTDKTYLPPTYYTSCIKAYRRLTRFTYLGLPYEYPSTTAVISTFDYLGGGTISGGTTFINGVPIINQTPATGGLCDGYYYSYTWELSLDNINWTTIGIGVVYPAGAQIPGTCYIRRRVDCGGQFAYSNVLNIIPPILIAGTISGGGTVTFNTIPLVTQTAASGSVCTAPDFIYTWERSVNNGAWLQFGTAGINYPANAGIIGTCKIRRKVHCIFEDGYSNEISFTMLPYTSPNAENLNYVRTNDIVIPSVHSWEQADNLITGDKLQTTSYLDGFGRPIQKVVKQGSLKQSNTPLDPNDINNYQDLVGYSEYDGLGRTDRAFLPYATQTNLGFFKSNAQTEQRDFTNTKYGEPVGSNFTFSQTTYDGSPLNRVTNVKLPGANWNNNPAYQGISSDYDFYDPTIENVINWEIAYNNGAVPKVSGIDYEAGSLIKNNITDEKGKIIYEYKDLSGNVILKKVQVDDNAEVKNYPGWLNTYYVYDDFGRLRYTITPQAVMEMYSSHDWTIYNNIKNGLCFYQEYDKKGRVIKKHSPDGGEVWLVYDNRDRLVLSQDENQRNRVNTTPSKPNQWSFSLYDENDRNVATGLINDARNRNDMQSFVDGLTNQNQPVEIYTGAWETITAYTPVAGKIPGTSAYYCQSCTASFTNSVSYYDDYSHRPSTQNYITLASNDFAPSTNPYVEQPVLSSRVKGMATVSKIRILDDKYDNGVITDERFLTSTTYIDEKGRVIQSHAENIKSGIDVSAVQYDFASKVLSTRGKHNATGSVFSGLMIINKNDYDLLSRPVKLWKLYTKNNADISNPSKYKKLSEIALDEFGRGSTKKIGDDPANPGNPLEIQDISYNIQGWLTGINKDYALANGGISNMNDQWIRKFGFYLGYENGDNKFAASQWNSSITGVIWRSQGDNTPRKYDYEYDNINRFKTANFTQRQTLASPAWVNNIVDVSVSVSDYDANGNIQGMIQKGLVPGTVGGVILDDLQYQYYDKSNKLMNITDLADIAVSGKQGDFKDYTASNGVDYNYDFNGNLKYDKNKKIIDVTANQTDPDPAAGIISNFLDLPQQIIIKDKSKTEYTYDAAGTKLAKKITQLTTGAPPPKTTYYIGGFVYEENDLQYILNEEGKLRIMDPVDAWSAPSYQVNYLKITGNIEIANTGSPNKWGVWDYYIKDNLSNTRMVLTEEYHQQQMLCSLEKLQNPPDLRKDEEEATFGITAPNNEVANTRIDKPGGWTSNSSSYVSILFSTGNAAIGPNAILKVMAGDSLDGTAKYYYQANGLAQGTSIVNNIVNSLFGVFSNSNNVSQTIKDNITSTNQGILFTNINSFINSHQPATSPGQPRAYLNYIFFDEQFRYVNECSNAIPVDAISSGTSIDGNLVFNTRATQNGYVFVYLSNETQNINVYFDDLNISHTRGAIVEDNVYYPFGLKIQGLSAIAAVKPKAKQGYQGDYNELDMETGYNEFSLRDYDPQIGRWIQVDPKDIEPGMYNGMGNNPINMVDPDGGGERPPGWYVSELNGSFFWDGGNDDDFLYLIRDGEVFNYAGTDRIVDPSESMGPANGNAFPSLPGHVIWEPEGKNSFFRSNNEIDMYGTGDKPEPVLQTISQGSNIIRPPEVQAKLDLFSKIVGDEERLETKRRKWAEGDPISNFFILGDISQMFKRFGHGDLSGGFEKSAWVGLDAFTFEIGGSGVSSLVRDKTANTIYRVVSSDEAVDVLKYGFRQAPINTGISSYEGKLFWTNLKDAKWFKSWSKIGEGDQIFKIRVNKNFIFENGTDFGKQFYYVTEERLQLFNSAIKSIQ